MYELVTPPAEEPLTLVEAKAHCRIDHADEDDLLDAFIVAAREYVEDLTWRQLVTATWKLYLDDFPRGRQIRLNKPPIQSITSIEYYDVEGDLQTFAASKYWVDTIHAPGGILLKNGEAWPVVEVDRPNAVIITFVAGYGAAAAVPEKAKHAMRLLISHWDQNREAVLTGTISKEVEFSVRALIGLLCWTGIPFADRC
jgi:uncharacterized phiE125 gp8 family phage protein